MTAEEFFKFRYGRESLEYTEEMEMVTFAREYHQHADRWRQFPEEVPNPHVTGTYLVEDKNGIGTANYGPSPQHHELWLWGGVIRWKPINLPK